MPQTYTVQINHQGKVHTIQVPEDKTVLRAADAAGLYLPSSCNAGALPGLQKDLWIKLMVWG